MIEKNKSNAGDVRKTEIQRLLIEFMQGRYDEAVSDEHATLEFLEVGETAPIELADGSDGASEEYGSNVPAESPITADEVKVAIAGLIENGQLIRTKKGKIGPSELFGIYAGKITLNAKGFGFLIRDNRELSDIFIPTKNLNEAMNGDRVLVKVKESGGRGHGNTGVTKAGERQEGEVIQIISRGVKTVTGTFHRNRNFGFVVPDNQKIIHDIYISKFNAQDVQDGYKVVVEITKWPSEGNNPEGRILEILGHKDDKGIDILSIAKSRGLPMEFPEEVLAQAEKVPAEVQETDLAKRRDLRQDLIITIDGDDAKDLDDAVSLRKNEKGQFVLGVHIADVSQYVFENSPLDVEALDRGTSVYMVDRVLPMLPPRLSNGICSLNPKVDRLTLSCEMVISNDGAVLSYEIFESVIRTTERMTYKNVNKIFDEDPETLEKYAHIRELVLEMKKLQEILYRRRATRGAIEFEFPETKITLDEKGFPIDIRPYERGISERVIEEFMLICNETVAEDMFWKELPFVYRVHETPDPERIQKFSDFVHNFNIRIAGSAEDLHPKAVQQMMELIKGRREERLISTMMLRSLKKARYTPECLGHFGLAAKYYCHFTSPIRRYPDLIIHRIIKENIHGKLTEKRIRHYESTLGEIALHSSDREREADEAEREVDDMKKAEYMSRHVGEEFEGIITSVTGFGFYVELPSTIEGLVHVNSLVDDYYEFDEVNHLLRGERRNLCFRIGDEVRVRVDKADVFARKIDFSIIEKLSSSVGNTELSEGEATNVSGMNIKRRRTTENPKETLRNVRENTRQNVADKGAKPHREKEKPAEQKVRSEKSSSDYGRNRSAKAKSKMGFTEFVKTDKQFREVDEPYEGYRKEQAEAFGEGEKRVTGVDRRQEKKKQIISKSKKKKEWLEKPSTHRKGVNPNRGAEGERSFAEEDKLGEFVTETGQKTTNYYLEKYGNLKPAKATGTGAGPKGGGKPSGRPGGKPGSKPGAKSGGKSGNGGTGGGPGAGKSANKAGYEKRKGK